MRKITLFYLLSFISLISMKAQTLSTGDVVLNSGANYSVKFDINTSTNEVTLTLVGDANKWFGVAPGVAQGNSMGNSGDDVITYSSSGLQDRNLTGSFQQPNVDGSQDWSLVSDTTSGGIRTLVATRPVSTGDSNDFVFPTTETSFPIIWANGSSTNIGGGHSNRGGTVVTTTTLSADDFEISQLDVKLYPNPSADFLNINNNLQGEFNVEVYDVLGKRMLNQTMNAQDASINVQSWNFGVYVVRISVENTVVTKRFIKG